MFFANIPKSFFKFLTIYQLYKINYHKEKKLLMKLLEVDPLKRITAKEALSEILCMEDDEKELRYTIYK